MNDPDDTRMRLRNNRLSYIWLIRQLALRGIATDKTEMSSVINGGRKGAKAELILKTSNSILDDYESLFLRNLRKESSEDETNKK
jgi:hypothetical protein